MTPTTRLGAIRVVAVVLLALASRGAAQGETRDGGAASPIVAAIKPAPPYVIIEEGERPAGIAIDLWDRIGARLGYETEYMALEDLPAVLDAVESGRAGVGLGAISVTAEREQRLDFTNPFAVAGLAIAAPKGESRPWLGAARRLFSSAFWQVTGALVLLLMAVGALVWLAERKRNEHFPRDAMRGLGSGMWWSAVTMTTVGYGDKAPATVSGRAIALVWMFASIIIISFFTAGIASALTVSSLDTGIQGVNDLPGRRVATVRGTTSEAFLRRRGIERVGCDSPEEALDAVEQGDAAAAVYDRPVLEYLLGRREGTAIRVLPGGFEEQMYALVLPNQSEAREEINRALLEIVSDPAWQAGVDRYLGK
ncbi:MAG: transporter substrate-binding domain-containing protein [Phycisphaeraceae bacterium]|nr:transporter substrate-binding domain-containing protein [Phycisphaeraceae bacterium]